MLVKSVILCNVSMWNPLGTLQEPTVITSEPMWNPLRNPLKIQGALCETPISDAHPVSHYNTNKKVGCHFVATFAPLG